MLPDPAGTNHTQLNNIMAALETTNHLSVRYTSDCQPELTSSKALINYGGHFPAGSSYKSMMHFLQIYKSHEFKMFDYGTPHLNSKMYGGQEKPPIYPIDRIKDFPIALIYGKSDTLASPTDCFKLKLILQEQNSLVDCLETKHGHIGLLNPVEGEEDHLNYMINTILKDNVMD